MKKVKIQKNVDELEIKFMDTNNKAQELIEIGLENKYYELYNKKLKEIAIKWCKENNLEYEEQEKYMNLKEKELWLELYKVAEKIQKLEPWKYLWDVDLLVYICKEMDEIFYCSVMGHGGMHKALAIYQGEQVFGFLEMAKNQVPEHVLLNYDECITCNFMRREQTLPKNREIIKELDLSFRGTWISFENFEKGYEPSPINIKQVKIMIEALKNFYMMLKAIIVNGFKVDFENGEVLIRFYDEDRKLFVNYPAPLILPEKHYDKIKIDDEFVKYAMKLPKTEMEIEYEFLNYLPIKIRDNKEEDGRYYYPRARFMADRNSGVVILHDLIDKNDYENENDYIVESVEILINNFLEMGIPKSIYVRDEETKMFLKDIADKAKIKIIVSPKLKAIDKFYDPLGRMGM